MKEKKQSLTRKQIILIIGGVILSIILATIVLRLLHSKIEQTGLRLFHTRASQKSNSIEFGNKPYNMTSYNNNILKYDDWIIFSNGSATLNSSISNYKEGIYKYNTKTGQVIKLYDYNGYCLNRIGSELYFCTQYNSVYKVNLESLSEEWISNIKASYILVCDTNIIYRDPNGNNIYITDMNGKNKKLIAEYTEGEIQIIDGYIYYLDASKSRLCKKAIKTDELDIIIEEPVSNFYVDNNKIIYISGENLKLFRCEENTNEVLLNGVSSNFVFKDNNIYGYILDKKSIVEINIEDKKEQVVIDNLQTVYRLQMYDDNIYYCYSSGKYPYLSTNIYSLNIQEKKQEKIFFNTNY